MTSAEDLLILAWAAMSDRIFGASAAWCSDPTIGSLVPEMVLHEPILPNREEWDTAVARAKELFGVGATSTTSPAPPWSALAPSTAARSRSTGRESHGLSSAFSEHALTLGLDETTRGWCPAVALTTSSQRWIVPSQRLSGSRFLPILTCLSSCRHWARRSRRPLRWQHPSTALSGPSSTSFRPWAGRRGRGAGGPPHNYRARRDARQSQACSCRGFGSRDTDLGCTEACDRRRGRSRAQGTGGRRGGEATCRGQARLVEDQQKRIAEQQAALAVQQAQLQKEQAELAFREAEGFSDGSKRPRPHPAAQARCAGQRPGREVGR